MIKNENEKTTAYPKILLINDGSIAYASQTSITQKQIFEKWPGEQLMELSIEQSGARDGSAYRSIRMYVLPRTRFFLRVAAYTSALKHVNERIKKEVKQDRGNNGARRLNKTRIRQFLYSVIDRSPLFLHKGDFSDAKAFCPDVIYTMASSVSTMKLAIRYADALGVPIIPHFMDNWPESIQWGDNPLLKGYKRSMHKWLQRMYAKTKFGLTISGDMADDYSKRTGIAHYALYNSIDIPKYRCESKKPGSPIRFIYAGGLHLSRDKAAIAFGTALKEIEDDTGAKLTLEIYTGTAISPEVKATINALDTIQVFSAVDHNDVVQLYEASDYLVLLESFSPDTAAAEFGKYSISTKTAEYLATMRPIIYVGSGDNTLCQYLVQHGAAIVVNEFADLAPTLRDLVKNGYDANQIKNAYALCETNHDNKKTTERLRLLLTQDSSFSKALPRI